MANNNNYMAELNALLAENGVSTTNMANDAKPDAAPSDLPVKARRGRKPKAAASSEPKKRGRKPKAAASAPEPVPVEESVDEIPAGLFDAMPTFQHEPETSAPEPVHTDADEEIFARMRSVQDKMSSFKSAVSTFMNATSVILDAMQSELLALEAQIHDKR